MIAFTRSVQYFADACRRALVVKSSGVSRQAMRHSARLVNSSIVRSRGLLPLKRAISRCASPEIVALWEKGIEMMKAAGASIVEVSLPHTKYALPAYYIVAPAECSSNLARYDGVRFGLRVPGKDLIEMYQNTRGAGFGKEVRRRIMIGTYVLSAGYYDAYYKKAQQIRQLIARDFKESFQKCDVLLTPTAPTAAFAAGEKMDDPVTMYLNDMFTIPASMAGLPGISVPVGSDKDGLPLGLQLIGRSFDEETVLRSAAALEKAAAFTGRAAGY